LKVVGLVEMSMIKVQGRKLIWVGKDVEPPLIGTVAFGVIDRGTNLIQVRPVSFCVLSCIFCSTDAGPRSHWRQTEYIVDLDLLIEWVKAIVKFKGTGVEAHIDTVGDPLLYHKLPDLIHELKSIDGIRVVSLQTHAATLTTKLADKLAAAGLDRINLSIDTLDSGKAAYLCATNWYRVEKVMDVAEYIVRSTGTDVLLAPLLLPGINDNDIPKIIEWGLRIGVGKKFPPFGIQKFLRHKHGRVPKGIRNMSWKEFNAYLRKLEEKYRVKLLLSEEDFTIKKARIVPIMYEAGRKIKVKIIAPGWLKNEWLAVPVGREESRVITVLGKDLPIGAKLSVRIISNKHNIYLAEPV